MPAKPAPAASTLCRHCDEEESDHVTLADAEGEQYQIGPGSLEDNTFDPEQTAKEIKSLLHVTVY